MVVGSACFIDSLMNTYPPPPPHLILVTIERSVLNKSWRCCSSLQNTHLSAYGGCPKIHTHHTTYMCSITKSNQITYAYLRLCRPIVCTWNFQLHKHSCVMDQIETWFCLDSDLQIMKIPMQESYIYIPHIIVLMYSRLVFFTLLIKHLYVIDIYIYIYIKA